MAESNDPLEDFLQFHQAQLEKLEIPQRYWKTINEKITGEVRNNHLTLLTGLCIRLLI